MVDFNKSYKDYESEVDAVLEWSDDLYLHHFGDSFSEARSLFARLKSKDIPITDQELSWILMVLPLQLFDIAEKLNRLKLSQEVIKFSSKDKEKALLKASVESTAAKRNEEVAALMSTDKLLICVYASLVDRVNSEISFCRELIMSAKKLWDSRRNTEQVHPIGEVVPDYAPPKNKSYIKGG